MTFCHAKEKPSTTLSQAETVAGRGSNRRHTHSQQGRDHGHITEAVEQEAPALTDLSDHDAGNSRADDPRAVDHR